MHSCTLAPCWSPPLPTSLSQSPLVDRTPPAVRRCMGGGGPEGKSGSIAHWVLPLLALELVLDLTAVTRLVEDHLADHRKVGAEDPLRPQPCTRPLMAVARAVGGQLPRTGERYQKGLQWMHGGGSGIRLWVHETSPPHTPAPCRTAVSPQASNVPLACDSSTRPTSPCCFLRRPANLRRVVKRG
jgi:hypothetical protein